MKTLTEKISPELKEYLSKELSNMAESHLECWKDRYAGYGGNQRRMKEDLYINHDPSLEIERIEEDLGREMNGKENDYAITQFNKEVVRQWKQGRY